MSDLVNIAIVRGIASWKMTRDEEGHRNYTVRFKVLAASTMMDRIRLCKHLIYQEQVRYGL